MKKTFTVDILDDSEMKTVADLDFNELKYKGLILEVEQTLLTLQMRRAAIVKAEYDRVKQREMEHSAAKSTSLFQKIKGYFTRG